MTITKHVKVGRWSINSNQLLNLQSKCIYGLGDNGEDQDPDRQLSMVKRDEHVREEGKMSTFEHYNDH